MHQSPGRHYFWAYNGEFCPDPALLRTQVPHSPRCMTDHVQPGIWAVQLSQQCGHGLMAETEVSEPCGVSSDVSQPPNALRGCNLYRTILSDSDD